MNVLISFDEVATLIEQRFKERLRFTPVDEKRVVISYNLAPFMPTIEVKLQVEVMRHDEVRMTYECDAATALLITGAFSFFKNKLPAGVEVKTEEQRINIFPMRFEQYERLSEYVTLADIVVEEQGFNLAFTLV